MPYVEIDARLIDHPKLKRAARALRVSPMLVMSHLTCLWTWVMMHAPNGDVTRYSARDIADGARWTDAEDYSEEADARAEVFVKALLECRLTPEGAGFLERTAEGYLLVHDWQEYGGKLVINRFKDSFRKKHGRQPTDAEIAGAGLFRQTSAATPEPVPTSPIDTPQDFQGNSNGAALEFPVERSVAEQSREETRQTDFGSRDTQGESDTAEVLSSVLPSELVSEPEQPETKTPAPQRRRDGGASQELETLLAECDATPGREHYRAALMQVATNGRGQNGEAIRSVISYRLQVLQNWLNGDGAPDPPGGYAPGHSNQQGPVKRHLSAADQRIADAQTRLGSLAPTLAEAARAKYAHLATDDTSTAIGGIAA